MAYNDCICVIVRYYPNFLSPQNQQNSNIHFVLSVAPMQFIANLNMCLPQYYGISFRKPQTSPRSVTTPVRSAGTPVRSITTPYCQIKTTIQRLATPYFQTLNTINTFEAGHSASRCLAKQAAESQTIPLPIQKNPTPTNSQVRWPDKRRSNRLS